MEVIDFESQVADKRQATFVIFYALDGITQDVEGYYYRSGQSRLGLMNLVDTEQ